MGQGTHGVKTTPAQIEREVEALRNRMEPVMDELDHRRHELPQKLKRGGMKLSRFALWIGAVMAVRAIVSRRRKRARLAQ